MTTRGHIIFLQGTSSAGKTTLSRKLQESFEEPHFVLSLDVFENMAPEGHLERDFWGTLNLAASAMHHTIATYSDLGRHVIVDTVLLDIEQEKTWLPEIARLLHNYPALFVGVHCPLEELERRERERGDREIGQAKWQFDKVHTHGVYDVEINTHEQSWEECVDVIKHHLALLESSPDSSSSDQPPRAFQVLHERFEQAAAKEPSV